MSLLTPSEALTVSDAFLCSLYGDDMFGKWRELKSEMRFVTERDYISWLLEVANYYRNNEGIKPITNNAESGKVEVVSQVRADDNCNESQPLSVDQQQKLQLESSAQEPSDITLCQRQQIYDTDLNQPSTSHEYYQQRDGPVQKDTMDLGEEILEGISLKHYLNDGIIKQEVSEVEDNEQSEVSRKVNQQSGDTKVMNELSQENHIKGEDALIEGVSFKLKAPSGLLNVNNDENGYGDKFMSKYTNEGVHQEELSPAMPDGSVDQEFIGDADCLPTKMPVLQPRPCFVNMCDNNVFNKSQQLLGRVKRANHLVKNKVRCSQLSSPDCGSPPNLKSYRSGVKIHKCDGCNYSSASIRDLTRHKRTHTGEKPYRCDKCPYASAVAVNLVTHKRTHTGEKPYRCDKCPYAAARSVNLVAHKRTHTGEKPYRCDKCPYAARHSSNLVIHKRKHTGEKPYDRCD